MTALVLWLNIPLMVLVSGLMVGIPLWMVLRHPDRSPAETRSVPAYLPRRIAAARAALAESSVRRARAGARHDHRSMVPGTQF